MPWDGSTQDSAEAATPCKPGAEQTGSKNRPLRINRTLRRAGFSREQQKPERKHRTMEFSLQHKAPSSQA
ncbi:MAG: hypothetical protein K2O82_00795, partial [Alistipes sp.]|nr:hypothetical protein [Alistipes sp.]